MKYIQQGDVILKPSTTIPEGERVVDQQVTDKVLAYGEVTGHSHRVVDGEAEVIKILGRLYLRALTECRVVHEEHKPVVIPAGTYEINIVRETDWLTRTVRRVAD